MTTPDSDKAARTNSRREFLKFSGCAAAASALDDAAGDFAGGVNERSDFDWDGDVDPVDFGSFAGHFGH